MDLLSDRNLLVVIVILASFYFIGITSYPVYYDEGAYSYYSQQIREGETPYVDFFEYKSPGLFYLHASISQVFGDNVAIPRLFWLLISFLTLYIFYKIIVPISGKKIALVSLILILGSRAFLDANISIYLEPLVLFFIILGIYFILRNKSRYDILAAGISFGLAVWFKQTALLPFAAILLYLLLRKEIKKLIIFGVTTLIITIPIFMLYPNVFYNLFVFGTQINNMDFFTRIRVWLSYLLPVFWLGYVFAANNLFKRKYYPLTLVFLAQSISFLPLNEIWVRSFGGVVIFAGYFATLYLFEIVKYKKQILNILIVIILLVNLGLFLNFAYTSSISCLMPDSTCSTIRNNQLEVVDFLKDKEGNIFSDTPAFYYLLNKKSPHMVPGVIGAYVSVFGMSDVIPAIEDNNVRYIISRKDIYYEKLTSYNIVDHIQKNFNKVYENKRYFIFERIPQ